MKLGFNETGYREQMFQSQTIIFLNPVVTELECTYFVCYSREFVITSLSVVKIVITKSNNALFLLGNVALFDYNNQAKRFELILGILHSFL